MLVGLCIYSNKLLHLLYIQACSALQLMKYITKLLDKGVSVGEEVGFLFAGDLNPVAPKAQKKVPIPEGWVPLVLNLLCYGILMLFHNLTAY